MASAYYTPCPELDRCNELIEKYWKAKQYKACFNGHLDLAQKNYPLAECQVGYFYLNGYGISKDLTQAFYWTERAANHGDWDAQYNLATFYENAIGVDRDFDKAQKWYQAAAKQGHGLAIKRCVELQIPY